MVPNPSLEIWAKVKKATFFKVKWISKWNGLLDREDGGLDYIILQVLKGHFSRLKCLEFFWSKNYVNFASRCRCFSQAHFTIDFWICHTLSQ